MDGKDSRPWRGPIAVVGSGIAGLGAACLLSLRYQVDLYETADYFGGHTNTVDVEDDGAALAVDTGFIVFNRPNYPTLSALFEHLGVKTRPTDMSFAASVDGGRIEYAGDSLNALYAQRRNLISPRFQAMVWDILRFNRLGKQLLAGPGDRHLTLGEWLARERFGDAFRDYYLLPMAASIWSCPTATMTEFPALSLLRFFANHGLLDLRDRPQWHTVCGGSRRYVERMLEGISGEKRIGAGVQAVLRDEHGVRLYLEDGSLERYQRVVIATHADQALLLLDQADSLERSVLGAFRYQPNRAAHRPGTHAPQAPGLVFLELPGGAGCLGPGGVGDLLDEPAAEPAGDHTLSGVPQSAARPRA